MPPRARCYYILIYVFQDYVIVPDELGSCSDHVITFCNAIGPTDTELLHRTHSPAGTKDWLRKNLLGTTTPSRITVMSLGSICPIGNRYLSDRLGRPRGCLNII